MNNPAVTAPIIGPRTREQLTGNLQVQWHGLNLMKPVLLTFPLLSSVCKN